MHSRQISHWASGLPGGLSGAGRLLGLPLRYAPADIVLARAADGDWIYACVKGVLLPLGDAELVLNSAVHVVDVPEMRISYVVCVLPPLVPGGAAHQDSVEQK